MSAAQPPRAPDPAPARAIGALETLLDAQRGAMVGGDVPGLETVHARIQALLADPAWRRDAARCRDRKRVRSALDAAAVNAGLATRGEAHAARALAALTPAPSLYDASGALAGRGGPGRGIAA